MRKHHDVFFIQGSGFRVQVAASPQKRKPTPPRCAQQPLPREGARVDAPSFLWKEVPRRGGGWRGKALSPTHCLPLEGEGAPKGRIGYWRYERERGGSSQVGDIREHPSAAARSPFPNGEGKEEAASPQKRKPTPPRCAQQPLPREGARVDAPSFLWKEVPRRGG